MAALARVFKGRGKKNRDLLPQTLYHSPNQVAGPPLKARKFCTLMPNLATCGNALTDHTGNSWLGPGCYCSRPAAQPI